MEDVLVLDVAGVGALTPDPAVVPVPDPPAAAPAAAYFDDLYVSEYQPMVRLAFAMVRDRDRAEEIVQDAFAAVFVRSERVANPGGYLRQTVVNGCRRVLRRQRLADLVRRDRPGVSELGADHLLDAIDRLPVKRRAAVILRYYLDWSEADIAAALAVRPGTVKSMLHRSLEQLREDLA
jgi:RNA polymerase sigma factor (sigma-70 family)